MNPEVNGGTKRFREAEAVLLASGVGHHNLAEASNISVLPKKHLSLMAALCLPAGGWRSTFTLPQ